MELKNGMSLLYYIGLRGKHGGLRSAPESSVVFVRHTFDRSSSENYLKAI